MSELSCWLKKIQGIPSDIAPGSGVVAAAFPLGSGLSAEHSRLNDQGKDPANPTEGRRAVEDEGIGGLASLKSEASQLSEARVFLAQRALPHPCGNHSKPTANHAPTTEHSGGFWLHDSARSASSRLSVAAEGQRGRAHLKMAPAGK